MGQWEEELSLQRQWLWACQIDRVEGAGEWAAGMMQLERWPGATWPRLHGPQHSTLCSRVIGDGSICLNISWKQSAASHMF